MYSFEKLFLQEPSVYLNDICLDDVQVVSMIYHNEIKPAPTPTNIVSFRAGVVNLYQLRSCALDRLESEDYEEAEKIYRQLIELDFELPGTLCHLARVQLLMHNEESALKSIFRAWKLREKASKYVIPRIIFFRILFLLISKQNPSVWIGRFKAYIQDDSAFMDWIIFPTLKLFESKLSAEDFLFITALAEAIQHKDKCPALEKFIRWKK